MEEKKREIAYLVIGNGMPSLRAYPFKENAYIIGIDRGSYLLAKEGIPFHEAIGDFDSVSKEELALIKEKSPHITALDPMKDESDTAFALKKYASKAKQIVILGGMQGKRMEHFLANLFLLREANNVVLEDDYSKAYIVKPPHNPIVFEDRSCYYSFFPIERSVLSLQGFVYPLIDRELWPFDPLGLSNEIASKKGVFTLKEGEVLLFQTKKAANN